ncbi:MAG: histone deacetylase family protein [Parvularculaceae bacterium]
MTTLLFADAIYAAHETPPGHPERADRYRAVDKALSAEEFCDLQRRPPPLVDRAALQRVHPAEFISAIENAAPIEGFSQLDPDTYMSPGSLEAGLRAAGGAVAAVDAVYAGEAKNAFVACRPPGHHALSARAMGFGFFNNAAIAAHQARAVHGARRIAVVDFDVHHGNGTEAIFWNDEAAFYASSHEFPQYPGTGRASDRGAFDNISNAPLPAGTGGDGFRKVWGERLLPALSDFGPDFVVISAGFDAHRADPLGGLALVEDDFAWATREIAAVAKDKCGGRVVSVLEGGYDLAALARSAAAHVKALMEA